MLHASTVAVSAMAAAGVPDPWLDSIISSRTRRNNGNGLRGMVNQLTNVFRAVRTSAMRRSSKCVSMRLKHYRATGLSCKCGEVCVQFKKSAPIGLSLSTAYMLVRACLLLCDTRSHQSCSQREQPLCYSPAQKKSVACYTRPAARLVLRYRANTNW